MTQEILSPDRILAAAVKLFLDQGVRKTSVDEVAHRAGVTRVTVYRHFTDKTGLVRAVCQRIAAVFRQTAEDSRRKSVDEIDACLNRMGRELSELAPGNLWALLDEVHRTHPDVYEEFHAAREAAIDLVFGEAVAAARRQGTLRKGLNPEVLKAIFVSGVVRLIETPTLISSNVPPADIVATVTMVFRHGILEDTE